MDINARPYYPRRMDSKESPQSTVKLLIDSGMTESQIAAALTADGMSVTQPTIHRIKHGASTSYEIGCALVRLAQSHIKPDTSAAMLRSLRS